MAALVWDAAGEHWFETGTDRGVLYPMNAAGTGYDPGVAWNGLTGVNESPEGGDANDIWADNIKYASLRGSEKAGGSIEAYTYPDEFMACDGSAAIGTGVYIGQQARKAFGFCYRTMKGNDLNPEAGYLIHIFYGCTCSPSSKDYATVNDSPDAISFSWDFEANAVDVAGYKPTATVTIDSTKLTDTKLKAVEAFLYGGDNTDPQLPMPAKILELIA